MCGRYAAAKNAAALVEEFEVEETKADHELSADYNSLASELAGLDREHPSRRLLQRCGGESPAVDGGDYCFDHVVVHWTDLASGA